MLIDERSVMERNKIKEKAEFLRILAHPIRLAILRELSLGARCVSEIEKFLEISQSNVSQHLALLRRLDLIDFCEEGPSRCYYLTKPQLVMDLIAFLENDYPVFERSKEEIKREGMMRKLINGSLSIAFPELSQDEIKEAVRIKYSQVANSPGEKFNFPVGRKFAESVGYPTEVLDCLAPSFYESFTGAGNPQPYVDVTEGETLLDLGCGAGLDLYFYAQKIGPNGKLYGFDISAQMIDKSTRNLAAAGIKNFTPLCGHADKIDLADNSVDIITSNGIYNLAPDKEAVLREVFRVLKPGGRTIFSEIILNAPLEEEIRKSINDWFRCIGGALAEPDFVALMRKVGFGEVKTLSKSRNARTGHKLALCANIRAYKP
jgi:SAM-dependent methyltransferase/DNA-binding transcriptional ArsR family regulator